MGVAAMNEACHASCKTSPALRALLDILDETIDRGHGYGLETDHPWIPGAAFKDGRLDAAIGQARECLRPSFRVEAPGDAPTVSVAAYVVSRIPDDTPDHSVWSVRIEATGHGRWAVRNMSRCLNRRGEWEYEPQPSSRSEEWLATVRWEHVEEAIEAATAAEPHVRWNGLTPADVVAERMRRP